MMTSETERSILWILVIVSLAFSSYVLFVTPKPLLKQSDVPVAVSSDISGEPTAKESFLQATGDQKILKGVIISVGQSDLVIRARMLDPEKVGLLDQVELPPIEDLYLEAQLKVEVTVDTYFPFRPFDQLKAGENIVVVSNTAIAPNGVQTVTASYIYDDIPGL